MKCFLRSTRSLASLALALTIGAAPLTAAGTDAGAITTAIEQAIRARVGADVIVRVTELSGVRMSPDAEGIVAMAPPTVRIGGPIRFVLSERVGAGRARTGEATATVTIIAPAVRTRKEVARGSKLESGDLVVQASDLSGQLLGPLPSLEEAIGARARRDIGIDVVVTRADIAAEPLVRAGDIVRAHVRVGDLQVTAQLVAAEPGARNEIIRVVNQETRHTTRARIVNSGEVEVLYVP